MANKPLKTNDAAAYLGVSRSSLTNWVKQGLIKGGATPGGHYRFNVEELDAFAAQRGLSIPGKVPHGLDARILLIDDDPPFREFVREVLETFSGFELKEAGDGIEGALLAGTWEPDLVIVDLKMPKMNGIDFCRQLKKNEKTADTSVIIASAYLSPEARAEIQEIGVDVVMEKPVRLASLVAAVGKCANLRLRQH